jgi:hypothetical protein
LEASDKQPNGVASGAVLEAQASALFPGWMEKLSKEYTCKRAVKEAAWAQKLRKKRGSAASAKKATTARADSRQADDIAEVAETMLVQEGEVVGAPAVQAVPLLATAV